MNNNPCTEYHIADGSVAVACGTTQPPTAKPTDLVGTDSFTYGMGCAALVALTIALVVGLIATLIRVWTSPKPEDLSDLRARVSNAEYDIKYNYKELVGSIEQTDADVDEIYATAKFKKVVQE